MPDVVKQQGEKFWLEVKSLGCKRVGYLLCQQTEEAVLAHTFLFLTMAGTQEPSP